MSDFSVIKFLQIQHDIGVSVETLEVIERQQKTRRDVHKILWELHYQMTRIDDFFTQEENCRGVDDRELEWLEKKYEKAESRCYEMAKKKR